MELCLLFLFVDCFYISVISSFDHFLFAKVINNWAFSLTLNLVVAQSFQNSFTFLNHKFKHQCLKMWLYDCLEFEFHLQRRRHLKLTWERLDSLVATTSWSPLFSEFLILVAAQRVCRFDYQMIGNQKLLLSSIIFNCWVLLIDLSFLWQIFLRNLESATLSLPVYFILLHCHFEVWSLIYLIEIGCFRIKFLRFLILLSYPSLLVFLNLWTNSPAPRSAQAIE